MKLLLKNLLAVCVTSTMLLPMSSYAGNTSKFAIENQEYQFVTLTFHDVRDDVAAVGDRDMYAISTKNLAQYFAWLKQEGWNPIRLEDVWQARVAKKPLPPKAVLLTFDDGALSSYNRVFPLLKQYGYPAVFAIPTSWINGNTKDPYEAYGVGNIMTWDQMREMQKSGLAEFASHSDNMHHGILANPQKNMQPAAITREYLPQTQNYESEQAYQQRVVDDLKKSKEVLKQELGIDTQTVFWPYGAVTKESELLANRAGLPMSFSLGSVSTLADSVKTYQRALIMSNPTPEMIHEEMLDFLTYARAPYKQAKRYVAYDLSEMVSPDNPSFDVKLGQLLNQVNALKTNVMLLKVVGDENHDGKIDVAYFPNQQLPMRQDLLNRTVWQARTRISNRVYAELPLSLETKQHIDLAKLTADLVKNNSSIEGLMLETGDELSCAIENRQWDANCTAKIAQVLDVKERTKAQAKYYSNISNNYQTALKMNVNSKRLEGLKPLLEQSLKYADFLYLELDPIENPSTFKALKKQVAQLSDQQQQHLIVSFTIKPNASAKQWKQYQRDYEILKSLSIQKIGIADYQLDMGKNIQEHLYAQLSANDSPLSYRNPYETNVMKGIR